MVIHFAFPSTSIMWRGCLFLTLWTPLLLKYPLVAQSPFQKGMGRESFDKANAIRLLSDGGFILAGETESYGLTERDMLLVRTDAQGNVIWTTSFGGPEREVINDIVPLPDKGFLLIAEKYQPNKQEGEFLTLIKTDANGKIVWKKIFDEGGHETEGFSIQPTHDNDFVIAGMIKKLTTVSATFFTMRAEEQSVYLLKVDGQGNKIWSRCLDYGDKHVSSLATSVAVTKDGSYIITGNVAKKGNTDKKIEKPAQQIPAQDVRYMLLMKVKPNGSLEWAYEYEAGNIMMGYTVQEKKQGGYVIGGNILLNNSNLDIFLMSVGVNGNIDWAKTYGGAHFESVADLQLTSDGSIIVTGITDTWGHGASDVLLFKTDINGQVQWAKAIGGQSEEYPTQLVLTQNDQIVITGATASYNSESFDVFLIKTDHNGNSKCGIKNIPLQGNTLNASARKNQHAEMKKIEPGIYPPHIKKPDSNNIVQSKREINTKNWCDSSK